MAPYDEQFESQLTAYRRRRRLLVAKSINFKAARSDFKTVCRAKLSKPDTVKFFWRAADKPWNTHPGWAMLGFELRSDCRRAEEELKDFKFRGRAIKIQKASKVAHGPLRSTTQLTTPTTAAPTTVTTATTTPVAEGPATAAPTTATPTTNTLMAESPATAVAVTAASTVGSLDVDKPLSIDWDTDDSE